VTSGGPVASVIVTNHDYAPFLPEAIESALAQTHRPTEVIVVDDGSTDESRAVIARYGDEILSVLKEQGGQASAFNAGFARCRGEVVVFLDADDVLLPHAVELVVGALATRPEATKVQYVLEVVDADGRPIGTMLPPPHLRIPDGDLGRHVARFGNYPTPPTSGNGFPAWVLRQLLPMPETAHVIAADGYLVRAAALLGPVVGLASVGGQYREHGRNRYRRTGPLDIERLQRRLVTAAHSWDHVRERVASMTGRDGLPAPGDLLDVGLLAHRLASRKLAPGAHPCPDDTLPGLTRTGIEASLRDPTRHPLRRLASAAWFPAVAASPRRVVHVLAGRRLH